MARDIYFPESRVEFNAQIDEMRVAFDTQPTNETEWERLMSSANDGVDGSDNFKV